MYKYVLQYVDRIGQRQRRKAFSLDATFIYIHSTLRSACFWVLDLALLMLGYLRPKRASSVSTKNAAIEPDIH